MVKTLILFFICVLGSQPSFGNDFRTLDFGDLCENLAEKELKIGGKQIGSGAFNGFTGSFEYHGQLIANEVTISYRCDESSVFTKGLVFLNLDTIEETQQKANEVCLALEKIHGPPNRIFKSEDYPDIGVLVNWELSAYKIDLHSYDNVISLSFSPNNK